MVDIGDLDPETNAHEWLFPEEAIGDADRIEAMCRLREYVGNLSPLTATFRWSDVTEGTDMRTNWFKREMSWLVGSWEVPDFYAKGGERGIRWVNPNYKDRSMYSDVVSKCECGTMVTKVQNVGGNSKFDDPNRHTDECKIEWRIRAVARLMEARRFALVTSALLGITARSIYDRLHTQRHDVSHMVNTLGIDYKGIREIGYEKRRNTIKRIIREGYDVSHAARIYGISEGRIRGIIANETDYKIGELRP